MSLIVGLDSGPPQRASEGSTWTSVFAKRSGRQQRDSGGSEDSTGMGDVFERGLWG